MDGDCPLAVGATGGATPVGEDHSAEVRGGNVVVGEDVVQDRLGKSAIVNRCLVGMQSAALLTLLVGVLDVGSHTFLMMIQGWIQVRLCCKARKVRSLEFQNK